MTSSKESLENIEDILNYCVDGGCKYDVEIIKNDLDKLEQYRELFNKIKSSDKTLEYTGYELTKYYEEIENEK